MITRLIALAAAVVVAASHASAQSPRAIVGHWRGDSICIKERWNAACHDEHIVYDFTPLGADSARVHQRAYKIVGGKPELMGELDFTYDPKARAWLADFRNTRVHIVWRYEVHGTELTGRVNMIPSGKLARTVRAKRSAA